MSRRRLFAVAAASIALVALAGCRVETPADAAYVGDTRISKDQVTRIVDQVRKDAPGASAADTANLTGQIAPVLVFNDVAARFAAEKGYPAPSIDTATAAQSIGLPATDPFVELQAKAFAYTQLLLEKATPVKVTDAVYLESYNLLVAQKVVAPDSFPATREQLQQQFEGQLGSGVAVRNELTDALKRYGASINPAYLPASYPLVSAQTDNGQAVTLLEMPLGGSTQTPPIRQLTPIVAPSAQAVQ